MDIEKKVLKYYELVDLELFDEMLQPFSDEIIYLRGQNQIVGIDSLKVFFLKERGLRGTHTIEEINKISSRVTTKGSFNGVDINKEKIKLNFTDIFFFSENKKIYKRETILY